MVEVVQSECIYWIDDTRWVFRDEFNGAATSIKPRSHLHVNGRSDAVPDLHNIHFPAGVIGVEHIILHLVAEYGITCRLHGDELIAALATSYENRAAKQIDAFP